MTSVKKMPFKGVFFLFVALAAILFRRGEPFRQLGVEGIMVGQF